MDSLRLLGSRLAAQVEALGDTGVLTDEQESAALDALEEAGIRPEIRSVSSSVSSSTAAGTFAPVAVPVGSAPVVAREPLDPPALRGVLAGPRQLGDLGGRPVTLISAELWSDRFLADLYTHPGPEHRGRRARASREHLEWMKRLRRGEATERPGRAVAGSPLADLTWELRDEQGTAYRRTGGSAESGDHLDRQRMQWTPAPPAQSGRVTLVATDTAGAVVLDAEIPIPRPAT
ncbi:hypothetical protein ACGFMK_21695 [Amycolatopsis sp. NPDC049252]|uniref:hypothetical protein n=1 Tax=Amycolatopsis sp. NPDC049252 TaxID=3363933 RepID=UPI00371461CA